MNKVAFNTADRPIKAGLISFNSKEFLPYVMCDRSHYSLTFPPFILLPKADLLSDWENEALGVLPESLEFTVKVLLHLQSSQLSRRQERILSLYHPAADSTTSPWKTKRSILKEERRKKVIYTLYLVFLDMAIEEEILGPSPFFSTFSVKNHQETTHNIHWGGELIGL